MRCMHIINIGFRMAWFKLRLAHAAILTQIGPPSSQPALILMARQSGGTTGPGSDDQAKVGEGDRVTHIVGSAGMKQQTDDKATRDQQGYSLLEFTHAQTPHWVFQERPRSPDSQWQGLISVVETGMTKSMNEDYEADEESANPATPPSPSSPQRCRTMQENEDEERKEEDAYDKAYIAHLVVKLRGERLHMSHDGEARDFAIQKSLGSDGAECALPMTMMKRFPKLGHSMSTSHLCLQTNQ